ncbi:MAG: hypothetical protein ACI87W_002905 [Halieaceae bacterium]|jgi:hypothetical protein
MIRLLSLILVLQLAAVAVLYWPQDTGAVAREALLAAVERGALLSIEITDGEGQRALLAADGERWLLESRLPADAARIDVLLAALLASDPGYAIATSDGAAQRFSVDDAGFDRRVVLGTRTGLQIAYLGSSPGFRKVHARRDGDSAVYVLELNSYDAPATQDGWLDHGLLAQRQLEHFALYGVDFTLAGERWTRSDGETVSRDAMQTLLEVLAGLQVSGIAEEGDQDAAAAGEALRITLGNEPGQSRLTVLDNPALERFYLRSDHYAQTFNTSAYDAERLIDAAKALVGADDQESADAVQSAVESAHRNDAAPESGS